MSHLLTWLTDNVRNAATKCGALGASVYVPTPWNDAVPGMLVHVGAAPLPELGDLAAASAFAARSDAALRSDHGPAVVIRSLVAEGSLIPIPMLAAHWRGASSQASETAGDGPGHRRLADSRQAPPVVGWLGLRFATPPGPLHLADGWSALLELASALASTYVSFYGILTDPVTGLPGRAELQGTLRAEIDRARAGARPFSLLFVKLDQLGAINELEGRRAGDAALRDLIDLLQATLRGSDVVMRYGAATFALPLRDVAADGVMVVAGKIRRTLLAPGSAGSSRRLACAMGAVSIDGSDPHPLQPLDLLRRADQALGASCRDADRHPVLWRDGDDRMEPLDPLLGVFTGQSDTDYRNMRLLWEVLQVLAGAGGPDLADAAVARISALFGAARVALFQPNDSGGLRLVAGRLRLSGADSDTVLDESQLAADERTLNDRAFASGEPQSMAADAVAGAPSSAVAAFALPLLVERGSLGALYVRSRTDSRRLDQNDLPVLSGVARHLALALDREQLIAQQQVRAEAEQATLRAEVERLQGAVQRRQLVFRSDAMRHLLDTARRAAITDATVLVTGESGTGKEMLAHTLHELSARQHRPLVIVDCGAIPASLIDSELFGRERGAYTGAERRAVGRLAQADGGTVFLDEIGELPLEVQAKLLRFVQERTVTMVGSTTAQRIDVRIIAATNRVLEHEVQAGRFREDLFHRLNVVRVRIPALRERREDILLLARHFLDTFARQYAKPVRAFGADAERALEDHDWSGNIRQLQNMVLQAVVLAQGQRITLDDLQLPGAANLNTRTTPAVAGRAPASPESAPDGQPSAADDPGASAWTLLRGYITAQVAAALRDGARPIGKWLSYELVLRAFAGSGEVLTRAAAQAGLPDTTFVRRLRHAQAEMAHVRLPDGWTDVQRTLAGLLQSRQSSLADRVDDLLIELVLTAVPDHLARAAALVGVSTPTMKRRMLDVDQARRKTA